MSQSGRQRSKRSILRHVNEDFAMGEDMEFSLPSDEKHFEASQSRRNLSSSPLLAIPDLGPPSVRLRKQHRQRQRQQQRTEQEQPIAERRSNHRRSQRQDHFESNRLRPRASVVARESEAEEKSERRRPYVVFGGPVGGASASLCRPLWERLRRFKLDQRRDSLLDEDDDDDHDDDDDDDNDEFLNPLQEQEQDVSQSSTTINPNPVAHLRHLSFSDCSAFERRILHTMCEHLGLGHVSWGEGHQRTLSVFLLSNPHPRSNPHFRSGLHSDVNPSSSPDSNLNTALASNSSPGSNRSLIPNPDSGFDLNSNMHIASSPARFSSNSALHLSSSSTLQSQSHSHSRLPSFSLSTDNANGATFVSPSASASASPSASASASASASLSPSPAHLPSSSPLSAAASVSASAVSSASQAKEFQELEARRQQHRLQRHKRHVQLVQHRHPEPESVGLGSGLGLDWKSSSGSNSGLGLKSSSGSNSGLGSGFGLGLGSGLEGADPFTYHSNPPESGSFTSQDASESDDQKILQTIVSARRSNAEIASYYPSCGRTLFDLLPEEVLVEWVLLFLGDGDLACFSGVCRCSFELLHILPSPSLVSDNIMTSIPTSTWTSTLTSTLPSSSSASPTSASIETEQGFTAEKEQLYMDSTDGSEATLSCGYISSVVARPSQFSVNALWHQMFCRMDPRIMMRSRCRLKKVELKLKKLEQQLFRKSRVKRTQQPPQPPFSSVELQVPSVPLSRSRSHSRSDSGSGSRSGSCPGSGSGELQKEEYEEGDECFKLAGADVDLAINWRLHVYQVRRYLHRLDVQTAWCEERFEELRQQQQGQAKGQSEAVREASESKRGSRRRDSVTECDQCHCYMDLPKKKAKACGCSCHRVEWQAGVTVYRPSNQQAKRERRERREAELQAQLQLQMEMQDQNA